MMLRTEMNLVSKLIGSQIKYILSQGIFRKQALKHLIHILNVATKKKDGKKPLVNSWDY